MGLTDVTMSVSNPANPRRFRVIDFLVDSGAIWSVIPKDVLLDLGISPQKTESFSLADCSRIERETAEARFTYNDLSATSKVIFGAPGDATLLGALTLESLGLLLDPLRRELRPAILRI